MTAFTLEPMRLDLTFRSVELVAREWLTRTYVRVRLQGSDLAGFTSPGADDHIRIFFPETQPETIEQLREAPSREYTPLTWGDDWLELEFAIHGDEGIAAVWAATAPLGAIAGIGGPRGAKVLTGRPDAWLLAGDETAVPAIRRFARAMEADAVGRILIEVEDADHELPIETPLGVVVEHVHRLGTAPGAVLGVRLDEISADQRPTGDVFGFVAAEQSIVKHGRALLLERWGVPAEQVVVKGYWKKGDVEFHAPH